MNPPYGLILFGVAFFGFMTVVGVVQARRKKEKAYYISAVVSFLMLLWSVLIFLNQFVLSRVPFVAWVILSIVGLPKIREAMMRESVKQLEETDFSAPLRVREFLTGKAGLNLRLDGVFAKLCAFTLSL